MFYGRWVTRRSIMIRNCARQDNRVGTIHLFKTIFWDVIGWDSRKVDQLIMVQNSHDHQHGKEHQSVWFLSTLNWAKNIWKFTFLIGFVDFQNMKPRNQGGGWEHESPKLGVGGTTIYMAQNMNLQNLGWVERRPCRWARVWWWWCSWHIFLPEKSYPMSWWLFSASPNDQFSYPTSRS